MKTEELIFESYEASYFEDCLELFDLNCPSSFAPNERGDFESFLSSPPGCYKLGLSQGKLVAAFGMEIDDRRGRARITWIMVSPNAKGLGAGSKMMHHAKQMLEDQRVDIIDIAASHLSEPFFSKFGATRVGFENDGWGEGMHRVDMELHLHP